MITLLLIAAVTVLMLFFKHRYSYWRVREVPYLSPIFPAGNLWGVGTRKHISELLKGHYDKLKESGAPFGGIFFAINPVVLGLDLDFARNVLIKDFNSFHDRAIYFNERDDPLTAHLFTMEGSQWKNMRVKLTPTFTSGKMKLMFPIVRGCAEELDQCLSGELQKGDAEIELKDIMSRYTTDVIGNCAFGIECNSLRDPEAEFRSVGRNIFNLSAFGFIKLILAQQFRSLFRAIGYRILDPRVSDFLLKTVTDIVQYREKNGVNRNDFIDLMIKLKNGESLDPDSNEKTEGLTMKQVAAQSFVFFFAGFETSSTLMSFCLYELALNQEVQEKARQNVLEVLKRHGSLTYEAVHEMRYLENCMNESLRMHPPASNLFRTATQDYKVPGTSCTIEKGTSVMIPVLAIHLDSEYYPEPDRFDPERFSPEEVAKRDPMAFLPFGDGPRVCIGQRFGLMQARVGLAILLQRYRFSVGSKTSVPIKVVPSSGILGIKGGLTLKVEKIA